MAKSRRPFRFSKLIPTVAIFLTALAVLAALTLSGGCADAYGTLQGFGTDSYSVVGQTMLKTTYQDGNGSIVGSAGLDGGTASKDADDFSFVGDLVQFNDPAENRIDFSLDGIAVAFSRKESDMTETFYLSSRKPISAASSLDKALRDSKYAVTAQISASVEGVGGNTAVSMRYVWENGSGGVPASKTYRVNGSSVSYETPALKAEGSNDPYFSVEFFFPRDEGNPATNQTVAARIRSVNVRFIARLASDGGSYGDFGATLNAQVTGTNRRPVDFSSGDTGTRYVKPTDFVTLDLALTKNGAPFELDDTYRAIFAPNAQTAVSWSVKLMTKATGGEQIGDYGEMVTFNGVTKRYRFEIPSLSGDDNGFVFVLVPSIAVDTSNQDRTLPALDSLKIVLTADTVRPTKPALAANSDLLKYLTGDSVGIYYTGTSLSFTMTGLKDGETLYYTVCAATTGAGAEIPTNESPAADPDGPKVVFFPDNLTYRAPGGFAVAMIVIDAAGNGSEVLTFQNVVNVDVNEYAVSAFARTGPGGESVHADRSIHGSFHFTQNGNNQAAYSVTARRGEEIKLVYVFSAMQFSKYHLGAVFDGNNASAFLMDPEKGQVTIEESARGTTYTFRVKMEDKYIKDANARQFTFEFKNKIYAKVRGANQTFSVEKTPGVVPTEGERKTISIDYFYRKEGAQEIRIDDLFRNQYSIMYGEIASDGSVEYSTAAFSNAGEYRYKIELLSNQNYYCFLEDAFVIKKADPGVSDFTVRGARDDGAVTPWIEYGDAGGIGLFKLLSRDDSGTESDQTTSIGLRGRFEITNLSASDPEFLNPGVGVKTLTVVFRPKEPNAGNGVMNSRNYAVSEPIAARVEVRKKDLNNEGAMAFYYNADGSSGGAVPLTPDTEIYFNERPLGVYLDMTRLLPYGVGAVDVEYEYSVSGGDYGSSAPVNAGKYNVRATIRGAVSNYRGVRIVSVEIRKKTLEVFLPDGAADEFVYGRYAAPVAQARDTATGVSPSVGGFGFEYALAGTDAFTADVPENAGSYVARISVLDQNYAGTRDFAYRIRKVRVGDPGLAVSSPTPQPHADGTALRFGQPLNNMVTLAGSVSYRRADGSKIYVEGAFRPKSLSGADSDYVPTAEEIRANNNYSFIFEFTPAGAYAENFEFLENGSAVGVSPAILSFAGVSIPSAAYGNTLEALAATMRGSATYLRYDAETSGYLPTEIGRGSYVYAGSEPAWNDVPTVGVRTLEFRFVPSREDAALYADTTFRLTLTIERNAQELYVVDGAGGEIAAFTKNYGTKATVAPENVRARSGVTGLGFEYRYYKKYDGGVLSDEVADIVTAGAGGYFLEISVGDRNYSGSAVLTFTVAPVETGPGTNAAQYPAALGALEWGDSTFAFGASRDMTGAVYRDDDAAETLLRVTGTFSFARDATFTAPSASETVRLRFTPDDGANYLPFEFDYGIPVNKRTIAFRYAAETVYNAAAQLPEIVLYDGETPVSAEIGKYTLAFPDGNPLSAGTYRGTAAVADDVALYRGAAEIVFTVLPEAAAIAVAENPEGYPAGAPTLPEITLTNALGGELKGSTDGEVTLRFFDFQNRLLGEAVYAGAAPENAPRYVGSYSVEIAVSGNHAGSASARFDLVPANVGVDTVVIVDYLVGAEQNPEITPIRDGYRYNARLEYREANAAGDWSADRPKDAGSYETRVALAENGYRNFYELGVKYTVNAIETAEILSASPLSFVYGIRAPELLFTAYGAGAESGLQLAYSLRYSEISGGELSEAPASVGSYRVSVAIEERNYFGRAEFEYRIEAGGAPRNVGAIATSPVPYKADFSSGGTDGIFTERGRFYYATDAGDVETEGVFSVLTDGFSGFGVGVHSVTFEFRPASAILGGIRYEIREGDIEPYRGVTDVTVEKRALTAEDFTVVSPEVVDGIAAVRYDETQKGVTISATGAAFSPKEAKDVAANAVVTYKKLGLPDAVESTARPLAAGDYEVKITVKHDNYAGGFSVVMRIEKALPDFVAPTFVQRIALGADNALTAGDTVTSADPLYAYYPGTARVPIAGTFTVKESVTFDKANLQPFRAVFTPLDAANVASVETILYVYVESDRVYSIDSALFEPIAIARYGSFADASALTPKAGATGVRFEERDGVVRAFVTADGTEIFGDFRFPKTTALPGVGTSLLSVYFIPDAADAVSSRYQIVSFYATVTVKEQAEVAIGDGAVYATVAPGETYASAVFSASLRVVSPVSEGAVAVPPAAFRFADGFDVSAKVPESLAALPSGVRAVYVGGADFAAQNPDYAVRFVFSVQEAGILADRLSYEYHPNPALAISVENRENGMGVANYMGISFSGVGDTAPGFSVSVEAVGAPLVADPVYGFLLYDVGLYRVTVTIDKNSGYFGQKTFDFTIAARDIGGYIRVNDQPVGTTIEKTYLDSVSFLAKAYSPSTGIPYDADYTYRFREKGGTTFSESAPVYAGEYVLRIEVDASVLYRGYADFDFVIRKKAISISESVLSYTYGNAPAEIVPRLEESVSWEFSFVDRSGNRIYNRYPENAGEYTGRVDVTDPNYEGSASFQYIVYPAQVSVTRYPEYSPLRYGQALREASVLTPGAASASVAGVPAEARGTFSFADADKILSTGSHNVAVVFTPDNANYQSVSGSVRVTVDRASVTITIDRTDFSYDGAALDLSRVYTVYPSAATIPTAVVRKDSETGSIVDRIVGVGAYYVTFTVDTENYRAEAKAVIRIAKGVADEIQTEAPSASGLVYGQTLKNSVLSGGVVRYGGKAVPGTFRFLAGETAPSEIGRVACPVVFTPNDSDNYAPYGGYTAFVNVEKAPLEITVSDASCVYGSIVNRPTFRVNAVGGEAFRFVLEAEFENWIGKVMPAASIATKVVLQSDYYYGEKDFTYTVLKKTVGILFYKDAERTDKAETLSSVYGEGFAPYPGIAAADAVGADQTSGLSSLNARIVVEYRLPDGTIVKSAPKNAGDYYVLATYVGDNYNGAAEIRYTVKRARVTEIKVDSAGLNKQIYGSVSMPNVVTSPAGVLFDTAFGSGQGLPTEAGSYGFTVVVTDPNYERTEKSFVFVVNPKKIGIENIVVYDKAYDGVATLRATGTLAGIMIGDEVTLSLSAATVGGKSEPGEYMVVISSAKLGGRHAKNYTYDLPFYTKSVKIIANKVADPNSGSFVIFSDKSLSDGVTVEFKNVASAQNKENVFSSLLGQKAQVVGFSIKKDGVKTDLSESVRVYVKIPDRFQNEKNFAVDGLGALAGSVIWTRAGDYIWFDTARSGEIVFSVTDFPIGIVLIATGLLILLIGLFAVAMLDPIRKKRALMYRERGVEDIRGGKRSKKSPKKQKKSKKKPSDSNDWSFG